MAIIHQTTMTPSKLELLTAWLPTQPWYVGTGRQPELAKAGGFRLDDPQGEVGMEFMVVTDAAGDQPVSYHVPLSYRGASIDGADEGLVGTSEHGVLGRRWIYDGTHDPVLVNQLANLLAGRATPQAQNVSDAPDLTVTAHCAREIATPIRSATVGNTADGTNIAVGSASTEGRLTLHVIRVLGQGKPDALTGDAATGHVSGCWQLPDGTEARGPFVVVY